jgi:hypothetical protein
MASTALSSHGMQWGNIHGVCVQLLSPLMLWIGHTAITTGDHQARLFVGDMMVLVSVPFKVVPF